MTEIDHAAHIMTVLRRATVEDAADGISWYERAREIADEAGNPSTGAGILSALSPRMPWVRNVQLARVAFHVPLTGGALGASVVKANAIREGADPTIALGKGLKTLSFYANILDPSDPHTVTVDTHAIKVAGVNRDSVGVRLYHAIADGYREVADYVGLLPQQVQAITWTTYRRERGIV